MKILTRCDGYYDGGSLSVGYVDEQLLCDCTLFFKMKWRAIDSETETYTHAEIWEDHSFQWTSKIVGVTYNDSFHSKIGVSWSTARQILAELATQASGLAGGSEEIFKKMTGIANSKGS